MGSSETERLLTEISHLLADDHEYPLDGTLLYARLDRNMVAPSIFKERADHVLYRRECFDPIGDALLELWEAQETDDRWAEIEYVVRGGKFEVTYTYPDDIDPDEDPLDRRDRVVARHFGAKPIVYPPWPLDEDAPQYEL